MACCCENAGCQKKEKSKFLPLIIVIIFFFTGIILARFAKTSDFKFVAYVLLAGIYLYCGKNIFLNAWANFKKGQIFDENVLMLSATIAAFCIGAYEEGVSVMVFFSIGEFLQESALSSSKKAITELFDNTPSVAYIKKEDQILQINPSELKIDDVVIVKTGEKIPTDGIILKGQSTLDEKILTGESVPIEVTEGKEVFGGSINLGAPLEISVKKLYKDSCAAKIIDLVQSAQDKKSKTERFITTFARYYTPVVFLIALCVAVIPPLLHEGSFYEWIYRGLVVLMVSCPCALVISVPLGYFGGIGAASKNGILIKGADVLETLSNVKNIAFDKTGTLTKGIFKVTQIVPANGFSEEDVLGYASCSQTLSNHPIATAVNAAFKNSSHIHDTKDYAQIHGLGVKTTCGENFIVAGNDKILHEFNIPHDRCEIDGGTIMHVAANGKYVGYILISDEIKDDAKQSIELLRHSGVERICILSGDNASATKKIADLLGCDFMASLLPHQKVRAFEDFKHSFEGKSAFVGDGVNDAPCLALADVGMSMGQSSDLSKESADIVLTNNTITSVVRALNIAQKTARIVRQNIILALGIKIVFVVLGLLGLAGLWEAVFGDVGVALLALANAMRTSRA